MYDMNDPTNPYHNTTDLAIHQDIELAITAFNVHVNNQPINDNTPSDKNFNPSLLTMKITTIIMN